MFAALLVGVTLPLVEILEFRVGVALPGVIIADRPPGVRKLTGVMFYVRDGVTSAVDCSAV